MQLSFHFNDFFRLRNNSAPARSDDATPTFLVQSGVAGDLIVKDLKDSLLNDGNVQMEVDLEGYMRTELDTCVDERSEFRVTVEKKILRMTQAMPITGSAYHPSSNERHYPFNFDVQSWLRQDQTSLQHEAMATRNNFSSLPPSLKHEVLKMPQGVPRPRAGARVTYQLSAKILRNRRILQCVKKAICLLPSNSPSPPMCISDFKGEYCPTQKTSLRGSLYQKAGDLSVIVKEPKPLNIRANCEASMVELPVKLRLERAAGDASLLEDLCVEADVKWQFRFWTFVSMLEQRGPATLTQALASPATAHVRSSLSARTLKMSWRKWRLASQTKECTVAECEQSIWLNLPRSEVLTPTFWNAYLSRRYSICLQLKIIRPGTAKLEVEIPIQVGIENVPSDLHQQELRRDHVNMRSLFEDAEGDELLPQYSR